VKSVRPGLLGLLRLFLRVFFRRVEAAGLERVPPEGPLLLVLNHPNALIDPLFILCLAPRPVSFLAKAPLFRIPVVGWLVKALGSIPVHRRQDPDAEPARNREMFAQVRAHLARGGAVALFPEGTSHSDPRLKPLKTGAARIALGVTATPPLRIQPAGLYYSAKDVFRSSALVCFGPPFEVTPAALDPEGEPPADRVQALTARIAEALGDVTLQADAYEAHELVAGTERILASERREHDDAPRPDLVLEFDLRRRLLAGYGRLRAEAPERLEHLRRRIVRYEERLEGAGIDPWHVPVGAVSGGRVLLVTLGFLLRFLLLVPLGVPGLVLHYLPYRLIGFLSRRVGGRGSDLIATTKAFAAFLLFPATWLAAAVLAGRLGGWLAALAMLALAPVSGYAALRLSELAFRALGAARALALWWLGRRRFLHLQLERRGIREELLRLAEELGV
jgi:1-acyl-sn-glycerol-3-phosphate acyltransferase